MSTLTKMPGTTSVTSTATFKFEFEAQARSRRSAWQISPRQPDPEERLLERVREADQAKRRAEARIRIEAKRRTEPNADLFALLSRADYQIAISREFLKEIIEAYPEDE